MPKLKLSKGLKGARQKREKLQKAKLKKKLKTISKKRDGLFD